MKTRLPQMPKSITMSRRDVFDVLHHMDALSRGVRPTTAAGVRRELRGIAEKFFHVIQQETLTPKDEARIEAGLRKALRRG